MSKAWIGVDLDGTLAKHMPGDGVDTVGEPIAPMVKFVLQLIKNGNTVKIFTARVSHEDTRVNNMQTAMISAWCKQHLGVYLEVTCKKDYNLIKYYDDRAVQVVSNTGVIISI